MNSEDIFENTQVNISSNLTLKFPKIKIKKNQFSTSSSLFLKSKPRILAHQITPMRQKKQLSKINTFESLSFGAYTQRSKEANIFNKLYSSKNAQTKTPRINKLIQSINIEVQQEIEQLQNYTPSIQLKKINTIENSKNTEMIINSLNFSITSQRQIFNNLRSKRKEYKQKLQQLYMSLQNQETTQQISSNLQMSEQDILDKMQQIKEQTDQQKLEQQQLEFIKSQKKKEISKISKPIQALKCQLTDIYFQVQEQQKETNMHAQCCTNLKRQFRQLEEEEQFKKHQREKQLNEQLLKYKQRIFAIKFYEEEQKKDKKALEQRIDSLREELTKQQEINKKEEKIIQEELKQNDLYIRRQEELFDKIKQVSQVNSINDMLPHFNYLKENKEKLNLVIENLKQQLSIKKEQVESLKKDLVYLNYCTEKLGQVDEQTPEKLDNQLLVKKKNIDLLELKMLNHCKILTGTFTIVGKMLYQLSENQIYIDCNQSNVVQYLSEIGLKVESMLQAIQKHNFDLSSQNIVNYLIQNNQQFQDAFNNIQYQQTAIENYEHTKEELLRTVKPEDDEDNIQLLLKMNKKNLHETKSETSQKQQ